MTKTENRAAAKAYAAAKDRERREAAHADAVKADLEQLAALRRYLITGRRAGIPHHALTAAIDDYVELLTGDRTTLHAKSSSIG